VRPFRLISIFVLGVCGPSAAFAQGAGSGSAPPPQPPPTNPPAKEEPKQEPKGSLEDRVEKLEDQLEDANDEVEDLRSELADVKERQAANKPPTPLNVMNPQITAFLNGALRVDDQPVFTPDGVRIDRRPFLRTAEFDFRAAADPYVDAVAIIALEDEAGEGFGADLEEGYMILKRLPIIESAPLGLKLKLGRYRAPIGNVNRLHMHDLPWTTRPLPISRFLGTENGEFFESGFNPVGADAEVLLPEVIDGLVMEANADVVDGGSIAVSDGSHRHPGYLGHYNLFFTVHDTHDFNIGLSAYRENGHHRVNLWCADFLYKWKPIAAGEFHSVVLGGELFYADRKFTGDSDGDGVPDTESHTTPLAWYAFAQYQLSWHVYAGARYDYVQDIDDDSVTTQIAAGYLTYYTSEFFRLRAGYEHRWSEVPAENNVNSFLAEVNVVFGSHPTEPYWVNR